MIGCLMLMFPKIRYGVEDEAFQFLQPDHYRYYRGCIMAANDYLQNPEAADFRNWIRRRGKIHVNLKETTDYAYSGLIYQMFEFKPFSTILETDMRVGLIDLRPARNIALYARLSEV